VDLLQETGIARDNGRGRLVMDPGLVHAYLLTLATGLSADLGASPMWYRRHPDELVSMDNGDEDQLPRLFLASGPTRRIPLNGWRS
jgi:hypothetical protein